MHFPISNPLRQLPALLLLSSIFSALALPTTPQEPAAELLSRGPVHDPYPDNTGIENAYLAGSQPSVFFSNLGPTSQEQRDWPDTFANQIGGRTFRMAYPAGFCERRSGAGGRTAYQPFAVRFSSVFAQQATGTAYVLMRDDPDGPHPNSVWAEFERPALENGGAVDRIVKVDPTRGFAQEDLWVRAGARRSARRDVPDGREYVLDWDAPADGPYWLAPGE